MKIFWLFISLIFSVSLYHPLQSSWKLPETERSRQLPNNVTAFQGWGSAEGCIPPGQNCHPYYDTSSNNNNIKLNHSISAEKLGGRRNVCMLVFWLPWLGPKGWRQDTWKKKNPAVTFGGFTEDDASRIMRHPIMNCFATNWPHKILPGTSPIPRRILSWQEVPASFQITPSSPSSINAHFAFQAQLC